MSLQEQRGGTVAVVGGGLAGLAAAAALCRHGLRVELFEARRHLGGRAGSFCDPTTGLQVDCCQHVSMGCCTNLADFCRRTGIDQCFARHGRLTFIGPDGRSCKLAATGWLPAPLHLVPGLLRLNYLTLRQRLGIVRAMHRLARRQDDNEPDAPVGPWLRRHGQSERVLERFWSVVLVSALSETLDRASLRAARKVFLDGFMAARKAYELEVPQVPLGEIYDRRLNGWLSANGVALRLGTRVKQIEGDAQRVRHLVLGDGTRLAFDQFVVAVPWRQVRSLLAPSIRAAVPALEGLDRIEPAAITAVHLWFDRPITPLPHAVLVGRLSQWLFNHGPSNPQTIPAEAETPRSGPEAPWAHYYQVVISASHALPTGDRDTLAARVVDELRAVWPAAREASLVHHRVVTNPEAVFSVRPGLDALRPPQQTPIANLLLAGDWTSTHWPATMEGAVRSGYLAAEAVFRNAGLQRRILVPDLPRALLTRWLLGT